LVKRLKVDKNFIPCPWDADDEMFRNGIFEFNITKMPTFFAIVTSTNRFN